MASRWRMNNTEVCCRRWFRLEVAQLQRASSEPWGRSTRIGCHWRPGRRRASGELKRKRKWLRISCQMHMLILIMNGNITFLFKLIFLGNETEE